MIKPEKLYPKGFLSSYPKKTLLSYLEKCLIKALRPLKTHHISLNEITKKINP